MTAALADFLERTRAAAAGLGLDCQVRPGLVSADFRGGSGEDVLKGANLPLDVSTLVVGRFPVLFGRLPDAPEVALVRDAVRRYRNQGVVARSHLSPEQALDLQLWLIGPQGSEESADWRALALAIERDDRVARKFVWLPPEGRHDRQEAFEGFLARTFLARPWNTLPPQPAAQLDRMSGLLAVAADLDIPKPVLDRWFELAGSELEDGPELVDELIEAWPEVTS
jgi:hypothetical protein